MSAFTFLPIKKITNLTAESVQISFDTTNTSNFDYTAGQYITVKSLIYGNEERRAYSICSSLDEDLAIGVKLVEGGKMSTFLTKEVKVGDTLELMPPSGNFTLSTKNNHIVGICAGSGITPILSMIKTELFRSTTSRITLIYSNRNSSSVMFKNILEELEQKFSDRFKIHWFFSQEKVHSSTFGRIDKNSLQNLINTFDSIKQANDFYVCGPGEVIDNTNELLLLNNVNQSNIHFERFTVEKKSNDTESINNDEIISNVTVSVDGEDFEFTLSNKGQTILDAAIEKGADVPFSCKGAVCCTCRAKVLEGNVTMDANYSISEDEVKEGYVLGCQARPASDKVVVDFDEM
jgi:ring-1,2-phenylacetyl-CoA epoxidase subunit PaaE